MMNTQEPPILPYSAIVGQEDLKSALELSYITNRLGGVLISGQRGAGKSTAVRSFARMAYGELPITLPINATEDRVVGGWDVQKLIRGKTVWKDGVLKEANDKLLYIDEVNLLDDHIANIILDCVSTGVLVVQREGQRATESVRFVLVGTMNPEEGGLRPQLLDRFGLMVSVKTEPTIENRKRILANVLDFDAALRNGYATESPFLAGAAKKDQAIKLGLESARTRFAAIEFPDKTAELCIKIADAYKVEGHRADHVMAFAAKALAAKEDAGVVTSEHIARVAPMVLAHRKPGVALHGRSVWTDEDDKTLKKTLGEAV